MNNKTISELDAAWLWAGMTLKVNTPEMTMQIEEKLRNIDKLIKILAVHSLPDAIQTPKRKRIRSR